MILTERTSKLLTPWHRWLLAALAVALLVVVPTRAERGGGDPEDRLRQERLELDRRELALEAQLEELEGERLELEFERQSLKQQLALEHFEERVRELEAAGEKLEAELVRQRRAAIETAIELERQKHELEKELRADMVPTQYELRETLLRSEELELAGRAEEADALRGEVRAGKERLGEVLEQHKQRQLELEQRRYHHRLETLENRHRTLIEAGREEEAAAMVKALEHARNEGDLVTVELAPVTPVSKAAVALAPVSKAEVLLRKAKEIAEIEGLRGVLVEVEEAGTIYQVRPVVGGEMTEEDLKKRLLLELEEKKVRKAKEAGVGKERLE